MLQTCGAPPIFKARVLPDCETAMSQHRDVPGGLAARQVEPNDTPVGAVRLSPDTTNIMWVVFGSQGINPVADEQVGCVTFAGNNPVLVPIADASRVWLALPAGAT